MKTLYWFGIVSAVCSVITTIGIHSFITGPATFEEALQVYNSAYYIFSKWWVVFHCLFVIITIYALTHFLNEQKLPFANLGFVFYCAFGITEILRMLMVLLYMKTLRDQYLAADETLQPIIRLSLDGATGIGNMLFVGFSVFIIFGNLFSGLSCAASGQKYVRWIGTGLLIWAGVLVLSLVNYLFLQSESVDTFISYFNLTYQPAIRLAVGIVLLYSLNSLASGRRISASI